MYACKPKKIQGANVYDNPVFLNVHLSAIPKEFLTWRFIYSTFIKKLLEKIEKYS
jgi:hypothetical protein